MKRSLRDLLSEEVITLELDLGDEVEVDPSDVKVTVAEKDEVELEAAEDDDVEEASVAAGVAGYSLPLGMSNRGPNDPPPWASYASAIGGTPLKVTGTRTLKVRRMNKTDKY